MSPWCVGWGHERAARHCCSYGSGTCGSGMPCWSPSPVLNPPPCLDPSAVLPPQLCVLFTQHQTLLGGQIRVSILWKFRVFVELLLQFHKGCLPRRTDLLLLEHWIQLLLKEHLFPSALWELLLSLVPAHLPAPCAAGHSDGWYHMGGLREASWRLLFLWCYEIWCSWGFCCELHPWATALGRGKNASAEDGG